MKTISCQDDLKCAIEQMEKQRDAEGRELKQAFNNTVESLKPANLIRNTIDEVRAIPDVKQDVVKAALGLTVGMVIKKLVIASSMNPVRMVAGNIAEIAVAGYVAKHPEKFRSLAVGAIRLFMKLRQRRQQKQLNVIPVNAG